MMRIAASLALLLVCLSPAQAQLMNCANLNANPGDYKVVLDDFAFATPAAKENPQLAALRDTLQFNFNEQLDRLKESARQVDRISQVPMRLVFCAGRQPALDGSDFTDALAERLSDERVVVEMWGRLELSGAGATPAPSARIGYVMPPVQHYVKNSAPPMHVLAYPKPGTSSSVEQLESLRELSAFAFVGLGTKAARANRYDLAVWAFNRAEAGIVDAKAGGANPRLDLLLTYVQRSRCETGVAARNDVNYKGSLTLVPPERCGVEL